MPSGEIGRKYDDGAIIFHEEEPGECMFYISSVKVRGKLRGQWV